MLSVPAYVNFGLLKRFRKGATAVQAIHVLLSIDVLHCSYFHLEHMKHFTCTLSLCRKQMSSNKCSLHIQRCTAIWFTDRCCGYWKMFTNGLWFWCRRYFPRYIGQWNWSDAVTLLGLLWTAVGSCSFTGWSGMQLQEEADYGMTFDLGG